MTATAANPTNLTRAIDPLSKDGARPQVLRVRNQGVKILKVPTSNPTLFIEVEVDYSKGGMSMWDYTNRPRGYRLVFTPITDKGDGMIGFMLGKGVSLFIEEAARFSEKKLWSLVEKAEQNPRFRELLAKVAGESNVTIIGEWGVGLGEQTEAACLADIERGFEVQRRQVQHCIGWIENSHPQNVQKFLDAVDAANQQANPQKFDDVPRGGAIERLAFIVGMEKTEQEFQEWHRLVTS